MASAVLDDAPRATPLARTKDLAIPPTPGVHCRHGSARRANRQDRARCVRPQEDWDAVPLAEEISNGTVLALTGRDTR